MLRLQQFSIESANANVPKQLVLIDTLGQILLLLFKSGEPLLQLLPCGRGHVSFLQLLGLVESFKQLKKLVLSTNRMK